MNTFDGDPPDWIDTGAFPGSSLGKCLLGLTSVLDISVFKGSVKALTTDKSQFKCGELVGNIKVEEVSRGLGEVEHDVKERPEQPKASGMVSHLSPHEQYLVIRVNKCESLPIADFDLGTSDPYLRVAWDGRCLSYALLLRVSIANIACAIFVGRSDIFVSTPTFSSISAAVS